MGVRLNSASDKKLALGISVVFTLIYIFFQSTSIYGGDAGDLVSAAIVRGVAHPPGYPLYTLLAWILTYLPFSTIAWRAGLLSSIPAAVTIGVLYLLLRRFELKTNVAILTVSVLGFSYLYFLYAIVSEVFALHLSFAVVISYLLVLYNQEKQYKYLYLAAILLGLSLSHHHTILFLLPAFIYLVWPGLKTHKNKLRLTGKVILLILLGSLPYLYVVEAARSYPPVNWENPQTLSGLWRLVTRAIYGTFRSGSAFGLNLDDRILQLKLMAETIVIDFTKLGVILAIIGAAGMWFKRRQWFNFTFVGFIFSGPIFLFYAGFPAYLNFYLATFERFLLTPYIFLTIFIGFGIYYFSIWVDWLIRRLTGRLLVSSLIIFALLPLTLFLTNIPKLWPLKYDRTAERLGEDFLNTAEANALIFLFGDTDIFNTLYVYYSLGGASSWDNKLVFQLGALEYPFYRTSVAHNHPELKIDLESNESVISQIITNNLERPIYANIKVQVPKDYFWVRTGLLFRLYHEQSDITLDKYIVQTKDLFTSYQDPAAGALKEYKHVMLADVLRSYANAYRETAQILVKLGETDQAVEYLRKSTELFPDTPDSRIYLAWALINQQQCTEAENLLNETIDTFPYAGQVYQLMAYLYRGCYHDETKAQDYEQKYTEFVKRNDVLLSEF